MNPTDFLRAVWPDDGIFCLALPREQGWRHRTYDKIDDAARDAEIFCRTANVYFTVHSLIERQVPHLTIPDRKQTRVHRNMSHARCFFLDLDVGDGPAKFASRGDAIRDLKAFLESTGLPHPMVVSSGGGFHIYWRLVDALPTAEWRDHATRLRQLVEYYGFKADRSRITDESSVLRVAGTLNHKDPRNPVRVEVLKPGVVTPTARFVQQISQALETIDIKPLSAPKLAQAETSILGSNMYDTYDGPKPTMRAVLEACPQMLRLWRLKGAFSEPEWYYTAIGVGRFTEDGVNGVHKLCKGHKDYSRAACDAKIRQNEASQRGPSSCQTVASRSDVGDSLCASCPHQGNVWGPIQAGLRVDAAPPPLVEEKIGDKVITTELPDPPKPFTRLKGGQGIAVVAKNADGDDEHQKIFDYDLFPVRRLSNPQMGLEQQIWHVGLPRGEAKDFVLDADMLYDSRKFVVAISNHGIYPHKGHISHLQEYMVAYIAQLQKLADADAQCNHLGWGDDLTHFVLPDKILYPDGSAKPAQLSLGAQRASANIHKGGELAKQVELLKFYNHPQYIPNQFYLLGGLAAPMFFATGHHGIILNASGDAGASKSTTLYTAASFWGQPELYPINGTNNGATMRGRNERVTVLANLPVCVDEITNMPIKDAVDLAMGITQPGHRIRLQTDGVERATVGSYKATIMLTTANNSLHSMLSLDNTAGTAGSMRVFEIPFKANSVHKKFEADEFMFHLKQNFGHIGEQFIYAAVKRKDELVAKIRAKMRDIDISCSIQSSERFWSAAAATIIVVGQFAFELGLVPFDMAAVERWVTQVQIPFMRGVVSQEYSDPMSIVADYLEQINNNIIAIRRTQGLGSNTGVHDVRRPTGSLLAHYDMDEKVIYVLKRGFKDHCARTGANATKVIDELHALRDGERIISQTHTRRVLGAGTEFAKAQSWCFAVNMAHPAVSGTVNLKIIEGGGAGDEKPASMSG